MSISPAAYKLLIEGVTDYAIYMLDLDGCVVSWNPGAEQIKGYASDEIVGAHFSRFYTAEDQARGMPQQALRTAIEAGRFTAEGWRIRKDGTRFWAMVVIDPIFDDGKHVGFAKITRDMTQHRAAQQAALEAERRFRLLVQGVIDYAIFMLDPEGLVTNWNAGAQRIKGYSAEEIVGQHFSRFYTQEDREAELPRKVLATARASGHYTAEGWRVRKDGTPFWASVVLDAVHDDDGTLIGFAKITRDLTERREAQLELEKSREQLFQAQKMEAVGNLTGGLAHDFNNLLTGISGSLEMIKVRLAQGRINDVERYITVAQAATSRAGALTHRLLAFARRQTLDPKATDANKLVAAMEELVRRTIGPQISLETVLAGSLWPTLCDPNQLENAVLNLCINARDAMPDGGRLTIETANTWLDERAARERGIPAGQYVAISVTDTGTGMTPETVSRAFDPFFTTKPSGQGTGLGLSMIYGFVQQSGGQVRIYSELRLGTTVRIYLPRHSAASHEESESEDDHTHVHVSGLTVLVIDDEPSVRMLASDVLGELGYRVLEAADGPAGLKILNSQARIDLLVTDVGLPGGLNGRQVADAARISRPNLKVLFITGYAENAAVGNGHLGPGMHVLTKPFAIDRFVSRVEAILNES